MDEEVKRSRAKKKLLRVTFPNGKVICYNNATSTMIAVLNEIGEDRFSSIKLDLCHLPLLSKEIYPKYQKDMKPICEGWYLNAQSNSDTKFLQLKAINEQLELGLKIELGADFKTLEEPEKERKPEVEINCWLKCPMESSLPTIVPWKRFWRLYGI